MAGHSHSANIQHRKAAQDKKRGKIFTKLIREITVAAREGGGDVNSNPRLRLAVDKALGSNMTRDTVERAIKRGSGGDEGANMESIRYEGYGVSGVAVIIDCLTDNRNRTVAEVRHAFTKHGGNLATDGAVAYLFNQRGILCFPKGSDEDKIMEVALEAGAEDIVTTDDGTIEVFTEPSSFTKVKEAMVKNGLAPENAEVSNFASTEVALNKDDGEKIIKLLDVLEDLDDVQNVYSNANIPAESYQK